MIVLTVSIPLLQIFMAYRSNFLLYCKHPKIRLIWDAYLTMERIQINAPAAKLRGTVGELKIYRDREHGCNKGERGEKNRG